MSTLYDILEIGQDADIKQIKQAYYKLAHAYHPDVNLAHNAHELMAQLNKAYETLIDPIRRAEYDAILMGQRVDGSEGSKSANFGGGKLNVFQKGHLLHHNTSIYSCSFLRNTNYFLTSSFSNEIYSWEIDHPEPLSFMKLEGGVVTVVQAITQDKFLAIGASETSLSSWIINKGEIRSDRYNLAEWVCITKPSPCGKWIATGCISGRLMWTNMERVNKPKDYLKHKQALMALAWSSNSDLLATGSCESLVHIWDTCSRQIIGSITYLRSDVTAIAFSRCNQYIAVACVDLSISIFYNGQEKPIKVFFGHEKPIEALSFHPKNLFLASGSRDGIVYLWNMSELSNHIKLRTSYQSLNSVEFNSTGQFLLTTGTDRVIRIWELKMSSN